MSVSHASALSSAIADALEYHPSPSSPLPPVSTRPASRGTWTPAREHIWAGVWVVCVVAGLGEILSYEMTPAESGNSASHWPAATSIALAADRLTLVMFVHPRCPCTRASLTELSSVLQRSDQPVSAHAVILRPDQVDQTWGNGAIRDQVGAIPGLAAREDAGGTEHRTFGARTSGEVFVFRPSGELLFHGGVTAGRGHAGPNAGTQALDNLLMGLAPRVRQTPVYGCGLECRASRTAHADLLPNGATR